MILQTHPVYYVLFFSSVQWVSCIFANGRYPKWCHYGVEGLCWWNASSTYLFWFWKLFMAFTDKDGLMLIHWWGVGLHPMILTYYVLQKLKRFAITCKALSWIEGTNKMILWIQGAYAIFTCVLLFKKDSWALVLFVDKFKFSELELALCFASGLLVTPMWYVSIDLKVVIGICHMF